MWFKKSVIISLTLSVITFVIYSALNIFIPLTVKEPLEVHVKKGMTFSDILQTLYEKGLLRDKNVILLIGRITRIDRKIKTGFYEFRGSISPYGVIDHLMTGRTVEFKVTIPEGYNIWQIARSLDEAGIMTEGDFFTLAYNREFLESINIDAPSIEGYIFPDTYRFPKGMAPEDVLRTTVTEMRRHFTPDMKERAERLGLSERKVLTIASIIEK